MKKKFKQKRPPVIITYTDEKTKEKIRKLAKEDNRSMSDYTDLIFKSL